MKNIELDTTVKDLIEELQRAAPVEFRLLKAAVKERREIEKEMAKTESVSPELAQKYFAADERCSRRMFYLAEGGARMLQAALPQIILREVEQ